MVSTSPRLAWLAGRGPGAERIAAGLRQRDWSTWSTSTPDAADALAPDALVFLAPRVAAPCSAGAIATHTAAAVADFVAAAQQAVRRMARRGSGGAIVVVTDIAGVPGRAGHAAQATVSGALIGACKCLAKELGRQGISVNVIGHGFMPELGADDNLSAAEQRLFGAMRLGKPGTAEHLLENIVHLIGNRHLMTGQVLHVDDGLVM